MDRIGDGAFEKIFPWRCENLLAVFRHQGQECPATIEVDDTRLSPLWPLAASETSKINKTGELNAAPATIVSGGAVRCILGSQAKGLRQFEIGTRQRFWKVMAVDLPSQ